MKLRSIVFSVALFTCAVSAQPAFSGDPWIGIFAKPIAEIVFRETPAGARVLSRVLGRKVVEPTGKDFMEMLQTLNQDASLELREAVVRRLELVEKEYNRLQYNNAVKYHQNHPERYTLSALNEASSANFDEYFHSVLDGLKLKPIQFTREQAYASSGYARSREEFFQGNLKADEVKQALLSNQHVSIRERLARPDPENQLWGQYYLVEEATIHGVETLPDDLLVTLSSVKIKTFSDNWSNWLSPQELERRIRKAVRDAGAELVRRGL